jgi:NADH-quinone oxidoreductase subunit G
VELTTFPGEKLDNPYAMNTIDLCPVGALTSRDFRFKSRVWEMSSTDTVCVGCARGCNIKMWVRNNEILRLTPRLNPGVNDYWMCDFGRLNTFKSVNDASRMQSPAIRKEGVLTEVGWDEAISAVASKLKILKKSEIAALASPFATNEDNYLLLKLMTYLGVKTVGLAEHILPEDQDDILIRADKTPNATGARLLGLGDQTGATLRSIVQGIEQGVIKALYVIDEDLTSVPGLAAAASKLDFLVVHASNANGTTAIADVVLSSSTYAEKNGTVVNFEGRLQRLRAAVATIEQDRAMDGFSMSRLDKFGAHNDRWMKGARRDARPTWRILLGVANALGAKWKYMTADDVFNEMASHVDPLRGTTYAKIGSQGLPLGKVAETPSPVRA